jgi:hypothetical protein
VSTSNLNYRSTDDAFANSGLKFNYAARFEGYDMSPCFIRFLLLLLSIPIRFINIPNAGRWTFELESDDGSRLLVDDVQVVTNCSAQ